MTTTQNDAMACIDLIGVVDIFDVMGVCFGSRLSRLFWSVLLGLPFIVLVFSFKVIEEGFDAYMVLLSATAMFFGGQLLLCRG